MEQARSEQVWIVTIQKQQQLSPNAELEQQGEQALRHAVGILKDYESGIVSQGVASCKCRRFASIVKTLDDFLLKTVSEQILYGREIICQ